MVELRNGGRCYRHQSEKVEIADRNMICWPTVTPAGVSAEGQKTDAVRIEHQGAKSRNSKAQEAHITLCSAGASD